MESLEVGADECRRLCEAARSSDKKISLRMETANNAAAKKEG